jgi:hypothetical protein
MVGLIEASIKKPKVNKWDGLQMGLVCSNIGHYFQWNSPKVLAKQDTKKTFYYKIFPVSKNPK